MFPMSFFLLIQSNAGCMDKAEAVSSPTGHPLQGEERSRSWEPVREASDARVGGAATKRQWSEPYFPSTNWMLSEYWKRSFVPSELIFTAKGA